MEEHTPDLGRRGMLTAILGATVLGLPGAAEAQMTEAETANVAVVNGFVAAFSARDMNKVLPFLAADAVYRMTETTPPATGHDAIRARLGSFVEGSDKVEWQILDTFAKGPMVVNHRIDRFISTTRPLTWEGVGVFFVKDGTIKEWFDYTIRTVR